MYDNMRSKFYKFIMSVMMFVQVFFPLFLEHRFNAFPQFRVKKYFSIFSFRVCIRPKYSH